MCGIAGLTGRRSVATNLRERALRMTNTLAHRGPDGSGVRLFAPERSEYAVALGHRRLAIIDLSDAGLQPMANEDGTVWIVFNGEIYNFRELREDLVGKGHHFQSATDT